MSWLSEIAGKAEDLLNKVDKTTAVVLQNQQSSSSPSHTVSFNQASYSSRNVDAKAYRNPKGYGLSTSFSHVPSRQTNPEKTAWKNTSYTSSKKGPVSDDEKLLEFLNSSEPVLPELRKKSSKKRNQAMSDSPSSTKSDEQHSHSASGANQSGNGSDDTHSESSSAGDSNREVAMQEQSKSYGTSDENTEDVVQTQSNSSRQTEGDFQQQENVTKIPMGPTESRVKMNINEAGYQSHSFSQEDRNIRDLTERETDLFAALDAKDSQLAVLKVRLEEADQEIINKTAILEELRTENVRLLKDFNDGISTHSMAIEKFRSLLADTEAKLNKTEEEYRLAQNEHLVQISKSDDEKRQLAESINNLQKKINELSDRNRESSFHLNSVNRNLESLQQEYADYKQRAQRILQTKEKLINSLKEGNHSAVDSISSFEPSYAVLSAETEGIKQERDLLREELRKAMDSIEMHRSEIRELEKMAQNDTDAAREHCRNLEEQLHQERMLKEEVQHLNSQFKEEIKFLQDEIVRTKTSLNNRIEDRDMEIEKLRKQLMAKSLSTVSQDELESRLHALTENLIQKQTIVEALSTEKNSLILQLERVEQQLKEAQLYGMQHHHAAIGVNSTESDRKQKATLFLENPFDSNLTRNVKRVYGSIDAFSIRLGVFFRRYPVARLFVFIYMLILHIWVMVVLLTYEPEIHSPSYKVEVNQ